MDAYCVYGTFTYKCYAYLSPITYNIQFSTWLLFTMLNIYINIYNNIVLCAILFILINTCKSNWSKNFTCRWKVMFCVNEIVKMFGGFFLLMFCSNLALLMVFYYPRKQSLGGLFESPCPSVCPFGCRHNMLNTIWRFAPEIFILRSEKI